MDIIDELDNLIKGLNINTKETRSDLRRKEPLVVLSIEEIIQRTPDILRNYIDTNWEYFRYCKLAGDDIIRVTIPGLIHNANDRYMVKNAIVEEINGYRGLEMIASLGCDISIFI